MGWEGGAGAEPAALKFAVAGRGVLQHLQLQLLGMGEKGLKDSAGC